MEQPAMFTVDATSDSVRFSGEIDMSTAPMLIEAVLQAESSEIDLSGITFMDSSGMHALIDLKAARPSLRIVAASPTVRRLVQLTGLAEHLQVEIDA
jgi:anti-anti-sigma factor